LSKKIIKRHSVFVDTQNRITIDNMGDIELLDGLVVGDSHRGALAASGDDLDDARRKARQTMDNATDKAGGILETARKDAERIVSEARTMLSVERNEALEEAKTRGYKQGYADGHREGTEEAKSLVDEAEALKEHTKREREAALENFEPKLVELIMNILDKIALTTLRINPAVVLNLIKQGLSESSFNEDIILRVSKDDYELVLSHKDDILAHVHGGAELEIVADHSLGVGDCLIETPFGVVDSSINMQLDEIKQDLAHILSSTTIN
jgi:flagellar assembly protein FliH